MNLNRSKAGLWTISILVAILLLSCNERQVYEKYKKIPEYIWNLRYQVPFEFDIKDTAAIYNVYLNIRNASIYPFSNLWIYVDKQSPKGVQSRSRYEFVLANPDGSWKGDGLGDIFDNHMLLEERIHFSMAGTYTYTFQHCMRVDNLPAIMDIGLEIERVKE
jgi:gliding motility-associated lipoprotein GldH